MSEWTSVNDVDAGISPASSKLGIPDNHVITIRERRITVDVPTIIQNNVKTDTVSLDLDSEWDDTSIIIIFERAIDHVAVEVEYTAPSVFIPASVATSVTQVNVSVIGYNADRTVRLVTVDAPSMFEVIKSGLVAGQAVEEGGTDLLASLLQAEEDAKQAIADAQGIIAEANSTVIKSATTTGLAAGASPTASIENQVLKLGIPKGDKGDKGDQGEPGVDADLDDVVGDSTSGTTAVNGTGSQRVVKNVVASNDVFAKTVGYAENNTTANDNAIPQYKTIRHMYENVIKPIETDISELKESVGDLDRLSQFIYDPTTGAYDNNSIKRWLDKRRDGLSYGIRIPTDADTQCTKLASNAGIAVPTTSTSTTAGVDPYKNLGPFFYMLVNAKVNTDGTPVVTAIEGDGKFSLKNPDGDVFVLAPVLYYIRSSSNDAYRDIYISDTQRAPTDAETTWQPQPKATLPDGTLRPFMLYARYPLSVDSDGNPRSVSGAVPKLRTISHNSLITLCKNSTTGYSGLSYADEWYIRVMFLMKYATKNSQTYFKGCTDYNVQVHPTVAETGVKRIIVSNANAERFKPNSMVSFGTATVTPDRNTSTAYDIFDLKMISSVETYDAGSKALIIDTGTTFDTETTYTLSSMPWYSGTTDILEGDGSLVNNGTYPFQLQGIELSLGMYECVGDIIISNDSGAGWNTYVTYDSKNAATSVTSNYTKGNAVLPSTTSDSWKYSLYSAIDSATGVFTPSNATGGSSTTGTCDGCYTNNMATTGTREWPSFGALSRGSHAGLFCLHAGNVLSWTFWAIGSRLSAVGRAQG